MTTTTTAPHGPTCDVERASTTPAGLDVRQWAEYPQHPDTARIDTARAFLSLDHPSVELQRADYGPHGGDPESMVDLFRAHHLTRVRARESWVELSTPDGRSRVTFWADDRAALARAFVEAAALLLAPPVEYGKPGA